VRAVAYLHTPNSPYASVALGYGRLSAAVAARGDRLDIVTPECFPWLARQDARLLPFVLPPVVACSLWRQRKRTDVVVFHSYVGWVSNLLKFAHRVPTITSFHGLEPLFFAELDAETRAQGRRLTRRFSFFYGWLVPRLLRWSCRHSDRVACRNRGEADYLIAHGWTTPDRLIVVRPGAPEEMFVRDRTYALRARKYLFVSQWLDTKGTRYLSEAFTALVRSGADVELHCAGTRHLDGEVLGAFPDDVRSRVHNYSELCQNALHELYRECDVFVHPSLSEGFSNAQMEAMAAALPMIVTRTAPASDLLASGATCVFVPKRDAAALEAAMRALIMDRDLRQRLGQSAYGVARAWPAGEGFPQVLNAFDALVGRPAGA
jgi:glycosyltransferase involved in cell wall biosynthesis